MSLGGSEADTLIDIASGGPLAEELFGEETTNIIGDPLDLFGRRADQDIVDDTGLAVDAVNDAIAEQRRTTEIAQGFLSPFGAVGQRGIDLSGFLGDSQAQFDFLQNNPLFQSSLNLLDRDTAAAAASGGRLSAGDTALRFQNNALLAAQPLIDRQRQDIGNLLNLGTGIATTQANTAIGQGSNISNLFTDIGNVQLAGSVAQANNQAQSSANILNLAGAIFGASDSRLKDNAEIIGEENGYKLWSWDWNELAKEAFNLVGSSTGVMFSEVLDKQPSATTTKDGFGLVNYEAIGVTNGY